jgi:hypothetical protein
MNNNLRKITLLVITLVTFLSCTKEEDVDIAPFTPAIFKESFDPNNIDYNADFDFPNWINFAEAGTKKWIERDFNNSGYIQFSSFGSGQASNIGWAISPIINMDESTNEVLNFNSASNFVTDPSNKLEVLVSTNFDGTNVLAATWTVLTAVVANETTNNYTYVPSGDIDLSSYTGNIHVAFKVTGSGTNTNLDGLFQVDDIKVYSKN